MHIVLFYTIGIQLCSFPYVYVADKTFRMIIPYALYIQNEFLVAILSNGFSSTSISFLSIPW